VGLEKIKADENYNPTKLEQPKEKLAIEQLNGLFKRPKADFRSETRQEFRRPVIAKVLATSATATLTKIAAEIPTPNPARRSEQGIQTNE
jgi:hypothetical protein